jgi:hypothetical protein
LRKDDGFTRIRMGGVILASDEQRIIDNVYGKEEATISETLFPYDFPVVFTGEQAAPIIVRGKMGDEPADQAVQPNLHIDYDVYFWDEEQAEDFFIIRYMISNRSSTPIETLHAGFFADWVIRDIKLHRARFNSEFRLAFAYAEPDDQFAGIQLLTPGPMNHYAFDNKGANESIRLDDGFSNEEKFLALTSDRPFSGFFGNDNDVSSLISTGPHHLEPQETIEVAFALHLSDKLIDLEINAQRASATYLEMLKSEIDVPDASFAVHPNPFSDQLNVFLPVGYLGAYELNITNIQGQRIKSFSFDINDDYTTYISLPVSDLRPGMYLLQLKGPGVNKALRVLKLQTN